MQASTCRRDVDEDRRHRRQGFAGGGQHRQDLRGRGPVQQVLCGVLVLHAAVRAARPVLAVVVPVVG